jgi:5-dehydro-2-deoxygluconokinase
LAFEAGGNVGLALRTWPADHVVKCLVSYHPDDDEALRTTQIASIKTLAQACAATGHELLLEVIPPAHLEQQDDTLARAMAQIYEAGVQPDWWKLPPPSERGWALLEAVIQAADPQCRGILLLGLEASEDALLTAFQIGARQKLCRGFAVGRTLFASAAQAWFAGQIDEAAVVTDVASRYQRLIRIWQQARSLALSRQR